MYGTDDDGHHHHHRRDYYYYHHWETSGEEWSDWWWSFICIVVWAAIIIGIVGFFVIFFSDSSSTSSSALLEEDATLPTYPSRFDRDGATEEEVHAEEEAYFLTFEDEKRRDEGLTALEAKNVTVKYVFRDSPSVSVRISRKERASVVQDTLRGLSRLGNLTRCRCLRVSSRGLGIRRANSPRHSSSPHVPSVSAEIIPVGIRDMLQAPEAWAASGRGASAAIAFLDTGIDRNHHEFAGRIDVCRNLAGGDPNDCGDDHGHGTHVTGTAAAAEDGSGVVGAAPEARIHVYKVCGSGGSCFEDDIAAAIEIAWRDPRVFVISMSLGSPIPLSTTLERALDAAEDAGVLSVAAAGNDGRSVHFPAAYPSVVSVGAVSSSLEVPPWSSRGSSLELVAHGVSVYSSYLGGSHATLSGTSMAVPHVSGTAALLMDAGMTAFEARLAMRSMAADLSPSGRDAVSGYGLANAWPLPSGISPPPPPPPNGNSGTRSSPGVGAAAFFACASLVPVRTLGFF